MIFTHDTECALGSLAALVNTQAWAAEGGEDELVEVEDVAEFYAEHEYSGRLDRDEAELQALRELRPRLEALWAEDEEAVVGMVNDLLTEHQALPQLVRHDQFAWHIHAVMSDRPFADRIAVECAMAIVDLVRTGELSRLKRCGADDCDAVLVDLSRNRSKRFCDVGNCGNRTHVAAYRARRSG